MNDIVLNIAALNIGDDWRFYTDAGVTTLTILSGCGSHVSGNQIIVDDTNDYYCFSGKIKITGTTPYSYIRIVSPVPLGDGNGCPVSIDCDCLVSSLTTSTTTSLPSGVNTIYTSFSTY